MKREKIIIELPYKLSQSLKRRAKQKGTSRKELIQDTLNELRRIAFIGHELKDLSIGEFEKLELFIWCSRANIASNPKTKL